MTTDPAMVLVWPKIDESVEKFNNITGFTQYISPSFWLGELANWLLGQNPWEEASRMVAGDWKMVAESGVAIGHLAEFNVAFANALSEQTRPLFAQHWSGKAATDAGKYFKNLEQTLRDQVTPLQDMSFQIKKLAYGVAQTADRIKGLLEELTDELITLGVGSAVKAGVLYVTGGARAAASAKRAGQLWKEIIDEYNSSLNNSKTIVGVILGRWAEIQRMEFKSISSTGYDHLGVHPPKPAVRRPPASAAAPSGRYDSSGNPVDNNDLFTRW